MIIFSFWINVPLYLGFPRIIWKYPCNVLLWHLPLSLIQYIWRSLKSFRDLSLNFDKACNNIFIVLIFHLCFEIFAHLFNLGNILCHPLFQEKYTLLRPSSYISVVLNILVHFHKYFLNPFAITKKIVCPERNCFIGCIFLLDYFVFEILEVIQICH